MKCTALLKSETSKHDLSVMKHKVCISLFKNKIKMVLHYEMNKVGETENKSCYFPLFSFSCGKSSQT